MHDVTKYLFAFGLSWIAALGLTLTPSVQADTTDVLPIPTMAELDEVAAMLPREPKGVGYPITDRKAWALAARQPLFLKQLKDAEVFSTQPTPELSDELFNEVLTTGSRVTYERQFRLRTTRLVAFVISECIENQGKYLPAIESELNAILGEKSWGIPAYVLVHKPFGGVERCFDLGAAARAWTIATADYWLGDKLAPKTRLRIRSEMKLRVFDYCAESIKTGKPHWGWMTASHNWNPVVNSGMVGAALALLPTPQERALFVKGAQIYLAYYLKGFPEEGYANEGLGYWGYGFGSYLCLAETLYQATEGRINLFFGRKLRQIALFPRHFEIMNGVFPAFGDSGVVRLRGVNKVAGTALLLLINERWGMGWTDLDPANNDMYATHAGGDRLYGFGLFGFPRPIYGGNIVAGSRAGPGEKDRNDLRFYFKESSVLISRSARPGYAQLGIAIKGGNNGNGGHNHNDNGTFVVVCNGESLLVDPGMEIYTAKSFGVHRYESMMMNSYGHPVPYVGHTLQHEGAGSMGKIIRSDFSEDQDVLVMDLTSSYPSAGAKKIVRSYVLNRTQPYLEITDEAEFDRPTHFGSALVTLESWQEQGPGRFLVYNNNAAIEVTVTVNGVSLENKIEPLIGFAIPTFINPHRLGVNITTPSNHVVMRTRIVPTNTLRPTAR